MVNVQGITECKYYCEMIALHNECMLITFIIMINLTVQASN